MRKLCLTLLSSLVLAGCVPGAANNNTYEVGGTTRLGAADAERAFAAEAASASVGNGSPFFDKPLRFIKAPQPVMPREAIRRGIAGDVVVEFVFDYSGMVERVTVRSSADELLSAAVVAAVSQWQIEPTTMAGQPVKRTFRETFKFVVQ